MISRLFLPLLCLIKVVSAVAILSDYGAWLAAFIFFGVDIVLALEIFLPRSQWLCPCITHFETDRKEVWLTIDDGPDIEDTPKILDLLDQHNARATFFHIGERVERNPELVKIIQNRGHEVGCHTQTHPEYSFWLAGLKRTSIEVEEGLARLKEAGATPQWFRSPVGIKSIFLERILRRNRLQAVAWTIRSGDVRTQDPTTVAKRVERELHPGAIILMHEGPMVPPLNRVKAIAAVLDVLTAQGFACVIPQKSSVRPHCLQSTRFL